MRPHRLATAAALAVALVLAGCGDDAPREAGGIGAGRAPSVTVREGGAVPNWRAPNVAVDADNAGELRRAARAAIDAGDLYATPSSALPLLLALRRHAPDDARVEADMGRAIRALLDDGDDALRRTRESEEAIAEAGRIAAVARTVAPQAPEVQAYLARLDRAEEVEVVLRRGESALAAGEYGVEGGGAIAAFRGALALRADDARALQGLAAVESALIRRAEAAAADADFAAAERWLGEAARVRPGVDTVEDARARIAYERALQVGRLRDLGLAALAREGGLDDARRTLARMLTIAPAADPAAIELRERIELATHYDLFRPGQVFTDGMNGGGRGPAMTVIPHGAFRMGAADDDRDARPEERPTRAIRFNRGLAVSRHEVTVGQFRRFVQATGYRPRSTRRGFSIAYDERSGNLVRRGNVDWRADYAGRPAPDDLPVVHVSAKDAAAYADWLATQTGERYRLPSEAEFEYALRAGVTAPWPWGVGAPPRSTVNIAGALDVSPSGRRWSNAFSRYGDGAWGPAPVGRHRANRFGLHDMDGNVSEWVADCWHRNYRRAPRGGAAWFNPGCRTRVVRGGAWSSAPADTRAAWRQGLDADTTNARIGFRVVRDL